MPLLEHTGSTRLVAEPGEIVAVLGAPGSGKTRLGLELAFLARPIDGEVLLRGQNPLAGKTAVARQRPRDVTLLVQNAEDQLFARTIFDDVAFGPRHLNVSEEEIEDRVYEALRAVRLEAEIIADRSPFALSGGERRRVALAGVLAMRPDVLILDEPTSNLDARTREDFAELLSRYRANRAIVWLTSSAREAGHADRAYVLSQARTAEVDMREGELPDWRHLARAGIELPAVYELAQRMENLGCRLPEAASASDLQEAILEGWRSRQP